MSYRSRWYTDEGNLRSLGRDHIGLLFSRYKHELAAAGICIPCPPTDEEFYTQLAAVFSRPEGIPVALHEALFYIAGLDNDNGEARLVASVRARDLSIDLSKEYSTADKALLAWLENEQLVRNLHAQVDLDRTRSFVFFQISGDSPCVLVPFVSSKVQIEKQLEREFAKHGRGNWAGVECLERGDEVLFVVRHSEPFRRETQRKPAGPEPMYYWPVGQDLVVFDKSTKELKTNVAVGWLKRVYADVFGQHLFNPPVKFDEAAKYDLEAIRRHGRSILNGTAFGLRQIHLHELELLANGSTDDRRIRRAKDVFQAYEAEGGIPSGEPIVAASFRIRVEGINHYRTVTIRVPNRAKYTPDKEGRAIAAWMRHYGLIDSGESQGEGQT